MLIAVYGTRNAQCHIVLRPSTDRTTRAISYKKKSSLFFICMMTSNQKIYRRHDPDGESICAAQFFNILRAHQITLTRAFNALWMACADERGCRTMKHNKKDNRALCKLFAQKGEVFSRFYRSTIFFLSHPHSNRTDLALSFTFYFHFAKRTVFFFAVHIFHEINTHIGHVLNMQ